MNKIRTMVAYGIILGATASGETIATREMTQQQRIREGVRSGELTPAERQRLQMREANLRREIRRDRADGHGLSAAERRKIEEKQARLSRAIYRQKHDNQVRP